MTIAYNEHLSATQRAWQGQGAVVTDRQMEEARDFVVAARRSSGGPWIPEHEVLGALEPTDG